VNILNCRSPFIIKPICKR